jgi:hypothetical protein
MSSATRFGAAMTSALLLVALAGASSASAATAPLTCHASVLSISVVGIPLDAGQAGTPGGACKNDAEGLSLTPNLALGVLNVGATSTTAAARTTVTNGAAPISADARIETANIGVGSILGSLGITADVIESHVEGSCVDDYSTSGRILNLKINGVAVSADAPSVSTGLGLASVALNKVTRTATGVSRDAVRVSVAGLVTVVIGHAEAAGGPVCPPNVTPPVDVVTAPPSTGVSGGTGTAIPDVPGAAPPANVSTPTNGNTCARLKMWFVPRVKNTARYLRTAGPSAITTGIEHGVRHVTRGQLVTCAGKPIIGARIDVFHVLKSGKARKTGIRSRRDGLLTLILPSNLHTRTIQFEYRPNLNGKKVTARASVKKVLQVSGRTVY